MGNLRCVVLESINTAAAGDKNRYLRLVIDPKNTRQPVLIRSEFTVSLNEIELNGAK
jgi:hypothetical protein